MKFKNLDQVYKEYNENDEFYDNVKKFIMDGKLNNHNPEWRQVEDSQVLFVDGLETDYNNDLDLIEDDLVEKDFLPVASDIYKNKLDATAVNFSVHRPFNEGDNND